MITFADLGPVPTVHLFLRVPVPLPAGGWTWGELPRYAGVLAREFAYSARECESLVHTFGRTMTRITPSRALGNRFMIVARGPVTGLTLGMREWQWSDDLHDYKRAGEYLCGWREAIRAYYRKTGESLEDKRFCACMNPHRHDLLSAQRMDTLPVMATVTNLPHVRHREDVPHEGALPNLYGVPA